MNRPGSPYGDWAILIGKRLFRIARSASRYSSEASAALSKQLIITAADGRFWSPQDWRWARRKPPLPGSAARKADLCARLLTGQELEWMPDAMRILHDEVPNIDTTVSS